MAYIGGDVLELVCKHPTLGDFRFQPKANEAATKDTGGFRNSDDANGITGSGQAIYQMNRVRWSIEVPIAIDFIADTAKDVRLLAADPQEGVWTLTHVSGAIWKGTGKPVGDLTDDTNTALETLKISGSGLLEKIA